MADKKKFEKPQMEVIKMNTKVSILAGSGCCDGYSDYGSSRTLDDQDLDVFMQ